MEEQFKELNSKVDKILLALSGDDELGVDGLADKVKKNSDYIEQDKKMKWTAAGVITAITTFINYLIGD